MTSDFFYYLCAHETESKLETSGYDVSRSLRSCYYNGVILHVSEYIDCACCDRHVSDDSGKQEEK